jgi:hypothetical protein
MAAAQHCEQLSSVRETYASGATLAALFWERLKNSKEDSKQCTHHSGNTKSSDSSTHANPARWVGSGKFENWKLLS